MLGLASYSSSEDEAAAPSRPAAAADGFFGESEDEEEVVAVAAKAVKPSGLPSAAAVLSAKRGAAWLNKPKWAEPTQEVDAAEEARAVVPIAGEEPPDPPEKGDDMYRYYDPVKGWQQKMDTNIDDDKGGYPGPARQRYVAVNPVYPRDLDVNARGSAAAAAPTGGAGRGKQPPSKNKRGPDKRAPALSGKERTKQQRISGQSGIGESFRVWRSEEEMRQRQFYD